MSKTISAADPATAPPCPVSLRQRIEDLLDERIPHLFVRGNHPGTQLANQPGKLAHVNLERCCLMFKHPQKKYEANGLHHPKTSQDPCIDFYYIISYSFKLYHIISYQYHIILYYIICIYCII